MGIVTSTLRSVNAWAHLPSTLRAGYVLGWGALFGANVSFRVLESRGRLSGGWLVDSYWVMRNQRLRSVDCVVTCLLGKW
jgi:hypothetical protein